MLLTQFSNTLSHHTNTHTHTGGLDSGSGPSDSSKKPRPNQKGIREALQNSKDAEGDIKFRGLGRMPLPTHPGTNGKQKYCGAHYKDGTICRFGEFCKMDHTPIDLMDLLGKKLWRKHVLLNKDLEFNKKRVKSDVMYLPLEDGSKPKADESKKE